MDSDAIPLEPGEEAISSDPPPRPSTATRRGARAPTSGPQAATPAAEGATAERGISGGRAPAGATSAGGDEGEKLSFEQIISNLQCIVETLEQGEAPLEEALATYEQGVRLSRLGARRLDEAERRIEMLMSDNEDGVQTRPLEKEPESR